MAIVKVDPFHEFAAMQDRMNRLFGNVYLRDEDTGLRGSWVPPVDIYETENHDLVVRAELPGLNREDIEVTVENSTLVLKGEKKLDTEVKEENYRRIERAYGSFSRSFTIPEGTDAAKVTAEFKDGVLRVRLPKNEKASPKAVQVKVE